MKTADVEQVTPAGPVARRQPLRPARAGRERRVLAVPGLGRHRAALSYPVQDRHRLGHLQRHDGPVGLPRRRPGRPDRPGHLREWPGTTRAAATRRPRSATGSRLGAGWGAFTSLVGAGDLTGDGRADLIARDGNGKLWLYPGTGGPAFGNAHADRQQLADLRPDPEHRRPRRRRQGRLRGARAVREAVVLPGHRQRDRSRSATATRSAPAGTSTTRSSARAT